MSKTFKCKCGQVFDKSHRLDNHIGYMILRDGTEAREKHGRVWTKEEIEQVLAAQVSYQGY